MKEKTNQIKALSAEERPREKMENHGPNALTISELLAILIRTGSREQNAIELCNHMLIDNQNDLIKLSRMSIKELTKYRGIGYTKAITILAALELGRRRQSIEAKDEISTITNSLEAYKTIKSSLMDLIHEEFWVIFLSRANKIIKQQRVSQGGMTATIVDVKIILKEALLENATGIILAHNHPSGSLKPSQSDISITEKIKSAAKFMDIKVLDHIIVTASSYFSFSDEGML